MDHSPLIQDLAIVIVAGAAVTLLFRQLKLPVVLGYIVAGFLIGPHTPPGNMLKDESTIKTLSELGVIFLMFSLGLEFSLRKVKQVGVTAFIGASAEILLMGWLGYHMGNLFGWNKTDSIFLAALLAMSSTTIIIKALDELGKTKQLFANLVFGILIVEDIFGILILALISAYAATGSLAPGEVGTTVIQLTSFLVVTLVAGLILVPRLFNYVAKFKSNELLLMTAVALCFGISVLALKFGYSVALGAFLIGAVIAEARQIAKIEMLTHPVRDVFSAVFFVSIGLLIDPKQIIEHWFPIAIITAAVVSGKVVACAVGTFIAGHDLRTSTKVGMTLAQIGEFSFIIAGLGLQFGLTSNFIYPIAVAVSAITTLLTPFLVKLSDPLVDKMDKILPESTRRTLDGYTQWIGELSNRKSNLGMVLLRKWAYQIGLNLLLITAVFIGAAASHKYALGWLPNVPGGDNGAKAMLWLAAMLLSSPMFIAVFRKLQALAMLVSEMSVTESKAGTNTAALRAVISTTVVIAGSGALVLLTLVLSSAILPSWNVLIGLALALVAAIIVLRRSFVRVYAKAQIALVETFSHPPAHHEEPKVLPSLLQAAELLSITVTEKSPAAGKIIAELKLRSVTGGSIVGIERNGENIINPGPDEELQVGDQILLLGTDAQLKASEGLLCGAAAA